MKKIIILVISILLLCGCDNNDNKECIKSHEEKSICTMYQIIMAGKTPVMIPIHYECEIKICDEYNLEKGEEK